MNKKLGTAVRRMALGTKKKEAAEEAEARWAKLKKAARKVALATPQGLPASQPGAGWSQSKDRQELAEVPTLSAAKYKALFLDSL